MLTYSLQSTPLPELLDEIDVKLRTLLTFSQIFKHVNNQNQFNFQYLNESTRINRRIQKTGDKSSSFHHLYSTESSFILTEKSLSKGQRTDKKEVDALPLLLSLEASPTWLVPPSGSADFARSLFLPETQFPFLENLCESEEKLWAGFVEEESTDWEQARDINDMLSVSRGESVSCLAILTTHYKKNPVDW